MKFSIITPTHSVENNKYLVELYKSIVSQSYLGWEWIVSLNNGYDSAQLPELIRLDSRVKVVVDTSNDTNIGAIKNFAFTQGMGDVLVEVDHDDLLTTNCLEELALAFKDEEIGFVYSNSIVNDMRGKFRPHNPAYGWTYNTYVWNNEERYSMNHFEPTSHSLSYIWYAPDHIRAWRTKIYKELGGHNKALAVCDDHDLCIRTYLATKMRLIEKPLYIYRITGDNTWLERNEAIQNTTRALFNNYARLLAERDAELNGLLKIDIGGGLNPYKDYKTVDIREHADYVGDLNKGIPLPDNSVGVLNASHILEHLHDQQAIMAEIHRVLVHGGWAFIEVPSTDGRGAFQDPTHVSFWNENNFLYYTHKEQADFIDNDKIRFQEFKKNTYYPNKWMQDHKILVTCAVLVAIKEESPRFPGPLTI